MQTSKYPENLRKASLYHVDAGHNHRIFCFGGFSFSYNLKARDVGREVVCSVLGNRIFESGGEALQENSFIGMHAA